MQAIITKIIPATNTKPTRIKASCSRGNKTIAYGHANQDEMGEHRVAVYALLRTFWDEDRKLYGTPENDNPWARRFITGQIPSGAYVHVFDC